MQGYVLGATDGEHMFQFAAAKSSSKSIRPEVRTIYRLEPN